MPPCRPGADSGPGALFFTTAWFRRWPGSAGPAPSFLFWGRRLIAEASKSQTIQAWRLRFLIRRDITVTVTDDELSSTESTRLLRPSMETAEVPSLCLLFSAMIVSPRIVQVSRIAAELLVLGSLPTEDSLRMCDVAGAAQQEQPSVV